ncbi:MAG: OmpA family protein, partial [Bacteroidota bacterium]
IIKTLVKHLFVNHQSNYPMTRKIYSLLTSIFCLFLLTTTTAQDGGDRRADLKFNAQPKHMWEVGLHGGHFMVIGDVLPRPSFGAGLHVRRALDYAWSLRLDAMYGRAIGLEPRNSGNSATGPAAANPVLRNLGYDQNDWYHNYKTDFWGVDIQGVFSLNSFNFKNQTRKLNWYVLGGPGVNSFKAWYDAIDEDTGNPYDFNNVDNGLSTGTSRDDRREAASRVKDILDGDYETRAETASGRRSGNNAAEDERQINLHATVGAGVAYRINERINIAIEHQTKVVFGNEGDLLDGYRHRSTFDLTQYRDMINYTNIRLNVNLGNAEKASEPLWWVSPMDLLAEDIAEVKARPKVDMTDTDGDGVIDMIDQEKNSEPGCPVDTRGITLDSDKDGVVDCKDKEPYTPAGFVQSVDADGVAAMPTPNYTTEDDVNKIVDAKIANAATKNSTVVGGVEDWFLPMIHFDFNRYNLKNTAYGPLHHVATVMKQNPNVKVVVEGHTDRTSDNCYNDVLSFNRAKTAIDYLTTRYGISRNRLILRWGGEDTNLVPTEAKNMMNRRVEFKVANGETDMQKPDCRKDAGVGGTNFSGNKEAGY